MSVGYVEIAFDNFINYCIALTDLQTDSAALVDLGPIPAFPVFAITDASYTDVVAARDTWNSSALAIRENIIADQAALNTAITALISGNTYNLKSNTWTALEAENPGDFSPYGDNVWIGFTPTQSPVLPKIIVLESAPLFPFPNTTT